MMSHEPLTRSQALILIGMGIAVSVAASWGMLRLQDSMPKSQFRQYVETGREFRSTMRQDIQNIKITQDTTNKLIIDLIRDVNARKP